MLNVYDNGARIQTPWYAVFPPRSVDRVKATPPSPHTSPNDEVRENKVPHSLYAKNTYQHVEQGDDKRKPVEKAAQIMTSPVHTLTKSSSLELAWVQFKNYRIRHMPVVNRRNELCGILSDRDILKAWAVINAQPQKSLKDLEIREIMIDQVLAGTPDTSIRELAEAMTVRRIGAIPLLNRACEVVGVVTRSDILRTIMHQIPMELWT